MGSLIRQETEHGGEVVEFLVAAGLEGSFDAAYHDGVLEVTSPDHDDVALAAAMTGFVATVARDEEWRGQFPSALQEHVPHLRDFFTAQRAGTPITAAQTQHAVADVILVLRELVDRRLR